MKVPLVSMLRFQQVRHMRRFQEKSVRAMYWRGRSFDAIKFPERRRSDWQDWNYRSEIFAFSRRLHENLSETTLKQIFVHPSYVDEFKTRQKHFNLPDPNLESNIGLTHRGDEILTECIKPYLRYTFTKVPEDGIKQINDFLCSDDVLSEVARWIGCKEIILSTEYPPNKKTMAETVRALIAGIKKDLDISRARRFAIDMIVSYINDKDILDDVWNIPNPRETLNLVLSNSRLPNYEARIMFQTGIKTLEPCHLVGLYVDQKFIGSSAGENLDIAEECAALDAFKRMFDLKENRAPFVYGDESDKIDFKAYEREYADIKTWKFVLV